MTLRSTLHAFLLVPTAVGIALGALCLAKSSRSDLSEKSFPAIAGSAWSKIVTAIPASMPSPYSEAEAPDSIEDLTLAQHTSYPESNAFLVTCSILVLGGVIGLALLSASVSHREPWWFPMVRNGAMLGAGLAALFLWGFNLAFPVDEGGLANLLPRPFSPAFNSIEYGLYGIQETTDFLFIGTYSVILGCLLLTFCAGRLSAIVTFAIALPIATVVFPLVVSWKWGAGWIESLGNNYDFAGAALLHWLVGSAALIMATILFVFRKQTRVERARPDQARFIPGAVLLAAAMFGLNLGSTLDADPPLVAAVLQACLIAGLIAAGLSALWWRFTKIRTLAESLTFGFIAGMVSISGAADIVSLIDALVIGAVAGAVIPGVIFLLDKIKWNDPLCIGPIHGLGGVIGILSPALIPSEENFATPIGQLVLLLAVPTLAILTTLFIGLLAGATGTLFANTDKKHPPSLPQKRI